MQDVCNRDGGGDDGDGGDDDDGNHGGCSCWVDQHQLSLNNIPIDRCCCF